MNTTDFNEAVLHYCMVLGASETSRFRTKKRNATVGGVAVSAHLFGLGADVVYDDAPLAELRLNIGRCLGLLVIPEGDHDHLQPLDWRK